MDLLIDLARCVGVHFGVGEGTESGPFVARLAIARLPNGGIGIDYEATSREQGVQHREHSILSPGPDGRVRLYIAHEESPFVTELVESENVSGRFEQRHPVGPYVMAVVINRPTDTELVYAWWWAEPGAELSEQSRATLTLSSE